MLRHRGGNKEELDENPSMVVTKQSSEKNLLSSQSENASAGTWNVWQKFDNENISYTTDDVIDEFKRYANKNSQFNYKESLIIKFKQNNKTRTAETYNVALNSFKKFRNDEDLMLDCLTSEIIEAYEAWHKSKGNTPNAISFYIRIIRESIIAQWRKKSPKTRIPSSVSIPALARPSNELFHWRQFARWNYHLPIGGLTLQRDMSLISWYLRRICFIDIAFLKKTDWKNGALSYRRRKTSQLFNIEWTTEMQMLLDKYPKNPTEYLMPIITNPDANPEATTQIYFASFETSVVDKANSLILKSL